MVTGDLGVLLGVQRIQADVDAADAGIEYALGD